MADDVDLIALAAWLHRQAVQTEACADYDEEYGARTTLESAARLAQASQVVKEAADRQRQERVTRSQSTAANQA
jgi:hypothetical protein